MNLCLLGYFLGQILSLISGLLLQSARGLQQPQEIVKVPGGLLHHFKAAPLCGQAGALQ